jgi:hypothetical protein
MRYRAESMPMSVFCVVNGMVVEGSCLIMASAPHMSIMGCHSTMMLVHRPMKICMSKVLLVSCAKRVRIMAIFLSFLAMVRCLLPMIQLQLPFSSSHIPCVDNRLTVVKRSKIPVMVFMYLMPGSILLVRHSKLTVRFCGSCMV